MIGCRAASLGMTRVGLSNSFISPESRLVGRLLDSDFFLHFPSRLVRRLVLKTYLPNFTVPLLTLENVGLWNGSRELGLRLTR
jgi:hypothetical protein